MRAKRRTSGSPPWRGWIVRIGPDGSFEPYAHGFRQANGMGLSPTGELFVTDNQGDWEPVGPVYQVKKGRFHGHPASLAWTEAYRATNTEPSAIAGWMFIVARLTRGVNT